MPYTISTPCVRCLVTKAAKELIVVLLTGAGALYVLWGIVATRVVAGGMGQTVRATDWKAIGIGLGMVAVAALLGFLVKPKKA